MAINILLIKEENNYRKQLKTIRINIILNISWFSDKIDFTLVLQLKRFNRLDDEFY